MAYFAVNNIISLIMDVILLSRSLTALSSASAAISSTDEGSFKPLTVC
jgi:hypothetical protein